MRGLTQRWISDVTATAIAEFALIFPLLFTMLIGVFEIGNAIMANQRAITASQMVADLLTRDTAVNDDELAEALAAGRQAMRPFRADEVGFDIVSMEFDKDEEPQFVWRETTENMTPDDKVFEDVLGLGNEGDGVLTVTVAYTYRPFFGSIVIDSVPTIETAFARGRKTSVVSRN